MGDRDIIDLNTQRQFDTWILLPGTERIAEAGAGDPDNWQVIVAASKKKNLLHVKPGVRGSRTNLLVRTESGHTYAFTLLENSRVCSNGCLPDLMVFVEQSEPSGVVEVAPDKAAADAVVAKASAELVASQDAMIAELKADIDRTKKEDEQKYEKRLSAFRSEYPVLLDCDYAFPKFNKAPFFLSSVCTDHTFTYLKLAGETPPALYVMQDGKLSILPTDFKRNQDGHGGTLIVAAVVSEGRLMAGKKKLTFRGTPDAKR